MAPSTITDLSLATSTYLGGSGTDEGNAVAIQPDGSILVGGVFSALPTATPTPPTNYTLLGAATNASGSLLHFNTDGTDLQAITRLGNSVDDVDVNRNNGQIAVVGDFGLAMLSADGSTVLWSQSGGGIGDGGSAVYSKGRRVSVGSDGTVAAVFNGFAYLFDASGNSLGAPLNFRDNGVLVGGGLYGNRAEDIVVDGTSKQVMVAGWSQTSANAQSPWIHTYDYDSASLITDWNSQEVWRNYRWWASALNNTGLLADSRIKRISQGEDGAFYFVGNTDGGNTVFQRNPKYLDASNNRGADVIGTTVSNVQIDRWNNGAGASVGAFGYFARVNAGNGELPVAQFQYSSAGVNQAKSFRIEAITADASGNTYIGGQSSDQMPERASLTINGNAIGPRVASETSLIGVANDFASRVQLGSFTATGGAPGTITALASGGGRLVILGNTDGDIVTISPLDGTRDGNDVFLAVTSAPAPPSPGFTVIPTTALTVTEAGSTAGFTIVLTSQPTSDVRLTITSGDTGEVTVSNGALTFSSGNWNTPQAVTLNGVDDSFEDGNQTTTVTISVDDANSDDAFDGLADKTLNITTQDDDTPGFSISKFDIIISETGSDDFVLRLNAAPTSNVVFNIVSSDTGEVTASPNTVTFNSSNWNIGQTISLNGVADGVVDGSETSTITVSVNDAQSDNAFDTLANQVIAVTTTDVDQPLPPPVDPGTPPGEPGTPPEEPETPPLPGEPGDLNNGDPGATPQLIPQANQLIAISGGNTPLKATLTGRQAGEVGTMIMVVVDDAQGTVAGKLPGEHGYQTAALQRAITVLSGLEAGEFDNLGFERILNIVPGQFLQFGLIQGGTLDDLRRVGEGQVTWALGAANGHAQSAVQISRLSSSLSTLGFRLPGGNFDDFTLQLSLEDADAPIGSQLQGTFPESELIDLTGIPEPTVNATIEVFREADYDNTVSFFAIENPQGAVRDPITGNLINPGEGGYLQAALANRVDVNVTGHNGQITSYTAEIATGTILSTFLVVNGTVEALLDNDTSNDPVVYFNHIAANSDGKDHVRLLGNNLFGYEDLPGGGDADFDDVIVKVSF
jgi:hypothetical protein